MIFNDYDVGIRNKLEVINIFTPDGKINDNAPDPYKGLDRFAARKLILEHLKEGKFLEKIEKLVNKVPYGDRSNSIIEPYLTEQWFVDAKTLAIKAKEVVNNGKTKFFPENWYSTLAGFIEAGETAEDALKREVMEEVNIVVKNIKIFLEVSHGRFQVN